MKNAFTFASELLIFTASVIAIIVFLAILHGVLSERFGWPDDAWVTSADACTVACASGTPDEAVTTIYAVGGPYASCLEHIFWHEDGQTGAVHQQNMQGSSAVGWFQMMPSTFASTPQGREVDIWHASGEQQVAAARWLYQTGQQYVWNGARASGC
jgi:hypothetical protein